MKKYNRALLIAGITVLVFANSLAGGFLYDDNYFIVNNPAIKSLKNIPSFFTSLKSFSPAADFSIYRPLATLSYAMDCRLFGLNPAMFHLSSVLWHAAVCAMLYFTLSLLLNSESPALLSALLFAVHPVQAETVAWVSQRSNLISFFFFLLALYLWMKESRGYSVACYALALLGKEMAITLPLMLILYDVYWRKGIRKRMKYYMPFFITAVLYLILRTAVLGRISGQDAWAGGGIWTALLTALKAVSLYVRVFFLPTTLSTYHTFTPATSLIKPEIVVSLAVVAGIICLALRLSTKRKAESFFMLWFLITLAPVSNLIPLQQVMFAERFLYFPSAGFCVLVALALFSLSKKTALILMMLLLILCSYHTMNRNTAWKDGLTLWTVTARENPSSYRAYNNLGLAYADSGRYSEAIECYARAITLCPSDTKTYYDMGVAYGNINRYNEAVRAYKEAISLSPGYAEAHNNLGVALGRMGKYTEEIESYERAIELKSGYAEAHNNLGVALGRMGRFNEAVFSYKEALKYDPLYAICHYNLGWTYIQIGDKDSALEQYVILKDIDGNLAAELFKALGK